MRFTILLFLVFIGSLSVVSQADAGGDGFLAFKSADFQWDNNIFILAGNTIVFDKNDTSAFAIELSLPLTHGFNIGGEFQFHDWNVVSDGGSSFTNYVGYANIYLYTLQMRYKFNESGRVRPHLGFAAGKARFSLHSVTNVILEGRTYQVNAVVDLLLTNSIGLSLGAMRSYIDVDDTYSNTIKNYANIYQLSLNFHFP